MASMRGTECLRTLGNDCVKHSLSSSPTQSLWFERFSSGCIRRMGQDVRQDWAVPLPVMHALMERLEEEWGMGGNLEDRALIASIGAYAIIAFCGSLRGSEVFLMDLCGLRKYLWEPLSPEAPPHVVIPLLGQFKGEQNTRYHLTPLAAETKSGLKVRTWVTRLVEVRVQEGRIQGPAFCNAQGGIARSRDYKFALKERLQSIQVNQVGLIPGDVDILEDFGVS